MNHFQLVEPNYPFKLGQRLSYSFLCVKIHPRGVGVASVETDTEFFRFFHTIDDLSYVSKVRAHAVPLPRHVLQQYPRILFHPFGGQVQGVGQSLKTHISSHTQVTAEMNNQEWNPKRPTPIDFSG